jgi:hypothetical protein
MKSVKHALKPLDGYVLKHGNAAQKQATQDGIAAVAAAQSKTLGGNEDQRLSDRQVRKAGDVLVLVRKSLAANNQKHVHPHVDAAIKHVRTALKIN